MIRIVNERQYVEDMLLSKKMNVKRPNKDINSLIKYLYEQNPKITKQELIQKVNEFLLEVTQNELAVKRWKVSVKECVDNFMSYAPKFKGLSHVESVIITKHEIDMIMDLNDKKLEYVAFALLVYLKIKNAITGRLDNLYVPNDEPDIRMIKKISGLKMTVKDIALQINELQNRGYTMNGNGGAVTAKLGYVDYDSEDEIEILDFTVENIHLYYKAIITDGRLIYCKECGKLVLEKSVEGRPTSYCKKCRKQKDVEKTLRSRAKK